MKIGIIEDDVYDVISRYKHLNKFPQELFVVLDDEVLNLWEGKDRAEMRKRAYTNVICEEGGFSPERIQYGFEDIPFADIYFCDGLKGRCFEMAERLGKKDVYIYSTDCEINMLAKEQGYNLAGVDKSLTEIIEERTPPK